VHFLGTCEKRIAAQCQIPIFSAGETRFSPEVTIVPMFAYMSFSPTVSFHHSASSMEDNIRKLVRLVGLHPKKGEKKKTSTDKKVETSTTKFHPPIFTHQFDRD